MTMRNALWALAGALVFGGCREPQAAPSLPPPNVNVARPLVKAVEPTDTFTGRIEAAEQVQIRPQVAGYLQSIHFADGSEVKKGDVLFQIDPRPFETELRAAEARRARAESQRVFAERQSKRLQELLATGASTQLEADNAADELEKAKAEVLAADAAIEQARLQLDYATVNAPCDGRTSRPFLSVGNLVGADTVLTTVLSQDPVYLYFDIDEASMIRYRALARAEEAPERDVRKANIPLIAALGESNDFVHEGTLDFVDNTVNPQTATIRARGVFANPRRMLVPGMFAKVRIVVGRKTESLLVPDRAIGRDQTRRFVLVVDGQGKVQYRPVEVGGLYDGMREIRGGLNPDERVIVDGVQRARPGETVNATELEPEATTRPVTAPAAAAK